MENETRETWAVVPATIDRWWHVLRGGVPVASAKDQETAERIMRFLANEDGQPSVQPTHWKPLSEKRDGEK